MELDKESLDRLDIDNTGRRDTTTQLAKALRTYKYIKLPEGIYIVGDLKLEDAELYGDGTLIKEASAEHTLILGSNTSVEGLKFTSYTNIGQSSEIKLDDGAENVLIQDCKFLGSLYAAISADENGADDSSLEYLKQANNVSILDNQFRGYSRAIYLHSVENLTINSNSFRNTSRDAIRLRQNVDKCAITNNIFKDIGESSDIGERPPNWSSLESYNTGDQVSVPPFGIYEAVIDNTTIGDNPATNGASEWKLLDGAYFETKDAVDAYWSGRELVISNNVLDNIAGFGFDIKGSEPTGDYSTESVLIDSNMITNCFGVGINFHSADLLQSGEFRYASNCIISRNVIRGCNAERYDISQAAINLRQGCSNITVSENHIKNHYGRALNVLNLQDGANITKSVRLSGNQILDCGIPGHPGNIGMNISAVDGLIIKDNVIENTDSQKEYELVASGTVSSTETLTIPTRVPRSDINVDLTGLTTIPEVLSAIKSEMETIQFPDDPSLTNIDYYEGEEVEGGQTATLRYQDLLITSQVAGEAGNDIQFELVHDNAIATGVYIGAVDVVGNKVTLTVRTSATMTHAVSVFNTYGPAAGATSLMSVELAPKTPTDILSQLVTVPTAPLNLEGGADDDRVSFFARLADPFRNTTFPIVVDGLSIDLVKNEQHSNSVNKLGINLQGEETVGSTDFISGLGKTIIKDNIIRNNAAQPRYEIMYENSEIRNLLAYVESDNRYNNTPVTVLGRTAFAGGAESSAGVSTNTRATLTTQGITLVARKAGSEGNNIYLTIQQGVGNDIPLSANVASLTTVNGYEIGGQEIVVTLPTDSGGNPVDAGVNDVENALRSVLQQAILVIEDNILE